MRKLLGLFAFLLALQASAMQAARSAEAPGYFFRPGGGSGTIASGTANRIPRYTAATTIGDGSLTDDGVGNLGMPATAASTEGKSIVFSTPAGGTSTNEGGHTSGTFGIEIGAPSAGNGTNKTGGDSGSFYVLGHVGTVGTGTARSGHGSTNTLVSGSGGASSGATGTAGNGGRVDLCLGAAGAANGGTPGTDGSFRILQADLSTVKFKVDYSGALTVTGAETITGSADAVQLSVKGHSTQTSNILEVKSSDNTKRFTIDNSGSVEFPYIFRVSGNSTASTSNNDARFLFYGGAPGGIFMDQNINLVWRKTDYVGLGSDDAAMSIKAVGVVYFAKSDGNAISTIGFLPTTPAQITANQDNYNPGGKSYIQRWSTDASRNVTGLTFTAAQVDGQCHLIVNVGAQNIVLKHKTTSTAANQFNCSTGADITLSAGQAADVVYDGATTYWLVFKRN